MYIKDFHKRYAKCVRTFCESVPSVLQVTTEEIDTYFRSCALYLWTHSAKSGDIARETNQLYTDSKVESTHEEVEDQINFYHSNPAAAVSVPDFFLRMFAFDIDSGTDNSRRFTEVQSEIFVLCAEGIPWPSTLDCRRMAWLSEQLTIICDEAEIGPNGSRGEKDPLDKETKETVEKEVEETMAEVRALLESIEREKQTQENDEREEAELNTSKER